MSDEDETPVQTVLWSDDPSDSDLLAFDALAQTLLDPLLDSRLDPIALGLSGPWGSGKSTVLGLVERHLNDLTTDDAKILVVSTQPWRYDPSQGAKESLIGEVMTRLQTEVEANTEPGSKALSLAKRLAGRIEWAKAIKVAAKAGIAMQIPSVDDLVDLVKPKDVDGAPGQDRSLDAFRDEFAELMASDELKHVRAVVVLVDDLDRCFPRTVVESLEAMRLFLAVPKMSFVIAADEVRVADALRSEFPPAQSPPEDGAEDQAELYLHKIVQTTLPIPALNQFDTQAYILLLQIQATGESADVTRLTDVFDKLRMAGKGLDDLEVDDSESFASEISFATRLTPILYERLRGNPRRIKRFLNDLYVRQGVALRRGIKLDPTVVAKLMVLEVLFKDEFKQVLDWLASGELRQQLEALERAANREQQVTAPTESTESGPTPAATAAKKTAKKSPGKTPLPPAAETEGEPEFSEQFLRWAKLSPSVKGLDLAPYLYLAASFEATLIIDRGLPERLKDIAANMLASTRKERSSVTDGDLVALQPRDATELSTYFGRLVRDQPSQQQLGVSALLRLARSSPSAAVAAAKGLAMIPVADLTIGTPILFKPDDAAEVRSVLENWRDTSENPQVKASIAEALKPKGL